MDMEEDMVAAATEVLCSPTTTWRLSLPLRAAADEMELKVLVAGRTRKDAMETLRGAESATQMNTSRQSARKIETEAEAQVHQPPFRD